MSELRSRLLRDNLGVAAGTALSRVTGVLRILAVYVAADRTLRDAYVLANNAPNVIYELILGGVLTATLVPLFTEHLEQDDEDATSAVVSTVLVALVGLTLLTFVLSPLLIALYSVNVPGGVDAGQLRGVGTNLALLFAPQVFFYGAMALGSALLNARKRFFAAAWTPVLNNVIVIAVMVTVANTFGSPRDLAAASEQTDLRLVLGLGTTAGIAAMALALLPSLRRAGVRIRWRPSWRHPAVRKTMRLSGWVFGYVIANQVAAQVVNVLAKPASGDVTDYATAFMFFQLPHGLLAVSLMTTFQPDLARSATQGDRDGFNRRLLLGLRLLALAVVPAAIGYATLARTFADAAEGLPDIPSDAVAIARVLAAFGLGLVGFSVYLFVLRGFYALQDTRTPFWLNCVENGLNIVLAFALVGRYGVEGLAAAYAIAYTVAAVAALAVLGRRHPGFDLRGLAGSMARIVLAAAVMGGVVVAVMQAASDGRTRIVMVSAAAIVAGMAAYAAMVVALRLPATVRTGGGGTEPRPRA